MSRYAGRLKPSLRPVMKFGASAFTSDFDKLILLILCFVMQYHIYFWGKMWFGGEGGVIHKGWVFIFKFFKGWGLFGIFQKIPNPKPNLQTVACANLEVPWHTSCKSMCSDFPFPLQPPHPPPFPTNPPAVPLQRA